MFSVNGDGCWKVLSLLEEFAEMFCSQRNQLSQQLWEAAPGTGNGFITSGNQ